MLHADASHHELPVRKPKCQRVCKAESFPFNMDLLATHLKLSYVYSGHEIGNDAPHLPYLPWMIYHYKEKSWGSSFNLPLTCKHVMTIFCSACVFNKINLPTASSLHVCLRSVTCGAVSFRLYLRKEKWKTSVDLCWVLILVEAGIDDLHLTFAA